MLSRPWPSTAILQMSPIIEETETNEQQIPTSHITPPPPGNKGIILLSLGSFNPPTASHIRLLISAYDTLKQSNHHVSGAYISPVGDSYASSKPSGLISAQHRVNMCRLALDHVQWADVMCWEAFRTEYTRSHLVVKQLLKQFGDRDMYEVMVVCGGDLKQAMSDSSRWPVESITELNNVTQGYLVKQRDLHMGTDSDINIEPWVGDLSSTVVRYLSSIINLL